MFFRNTKYGKKFLANIKGIRFVFFKRNFRSEAQANNNIAA